VSTTALALGNAGCQPATGYYFSKAVTQAPVSKKPSPGCGHAPPAQIPVSVDVAGQTRSFILAIPRRYNARQTHALVFAFHGRTNSNEEVRSYFDLEENATQPTIFVYPSGKQLENGKYNWADPGDNADQLRDYARFDKLLQTISERYCIALDRVYVVAHSLGAYFANSLACVRAARIRAMASLGGGISAGSCNGEIAVMLLHNPKDRLVSFQNGVQARDHFLQQNHLQGQKAVPVYGSELNCKRYGEAEIRNPVVWCPHTQDRTSRGRYYPHNWPQQTGQAIMQFFSTLP
jgi:polyhydroxybutyrate depolymerase